MRDIQFRYRRGFIMLALCAALCACGSLGRVVDPPRVTLTNVALVQANLLEQRYRLTLRVQNPNSMAIPIRGLDYAVKLSGIDFASGTTPNGFTLAALGEDTVDIDVSTNLLDSARQIYTLLRQKPDNLDYQLSGKIVVDMPFIKSIPFSRTGQVDLRGLSLQ